MYKKAAETLRLERFVHRSYITSHMTLFTHDAHLEVLLGLQKLD